MGDMCLHGRSLSIQDFPLFPADETYKTLFPYRLSHSMTEHMRAQVFHIFSYHASRHMCSISSLGILHKLYLKGLLSNWLVCSPSPGEGR